MGSGLGYGAGPVPVTVAHAPASRYPAGRSGPPKKSLPVMVVSLEKKNSTIGAPAPWVPWLHTVALTVAKVPGMALGSVRTEVMTKSGPFPTTSRFPAVALLLSLSSIVEL